jgi:hypothetical protein
MSQKKIGIGPSSAGEYFAAHVVQANMRFQNLSSRDNAITLAKALWDTHGWLWSDRNPGIDRRTDPLKTKAFDDDLFRRCPDFKLIRDIAEAAKHGGELNRAGVVVKDVSGLGSVAGTQQVLHAFGTDGEREDGPFGGMMPAPTPESPLRIQTKDGNSHDMKQVLATAFEFLLTEVN